ncbi:pyrroline-5-carboxylate reductase [Lachnospiraceae bacterium JLR.KK008]
MKTGIIGLGNMADAVINGMLRKEIVTNKEIFGSAASAGTISRMAEKYGIRTTLDNRAVAESAEVLILAVKPQFLETVIGEIRDSIREETLMITIAAGKSLGWYEEKFGKKIRLVRCMPNTPAMVGEGCTAVCANENVTEEQLEAALDLLGSFGHTCVIREQQMDAFSAVAGSSPAYVFLFIEALADGAVAAGMPRSQAYEAAAQAVLGSAKLLLESGRHPGDLKDMVCSPGGTTIQGLRVLEERGMRGAVIDAIGACVEKAGQL